jgi:hypothetical protein
MGMGLPHVGQFSLLKFVGLGVVGLAVGDKLHDFAMEKFPNTFGGSSDVPTESQQMKFKWLGYAVVATGVAATFIAAHAILGRKS